MSKGKKSRRILDQRTGRPGVSKIDRKREQAALNTPPSFPAHPAQKRKKSKYERQFERNMELLRQQEAFVSQVSGRMKAGAGPLFEARRLREDETLNGTVGWWCVGFFDDAGNFRGCIFVSALGPVDAVMSVVSMDPVDDGKVAVVPILDLSELPAEEYRTRFLDLASVREARLKFNPHDRLKGAPV